MNKKAVKQEQSESQQSQSQDDSQESVQERFIPKVDRNLNYEPNYSNVIINVAFTNYPVVREAALKIGLKVINQPEQRNWDLCWTDHPIAPSTFIRMHFHQTINYLTGIHTIARKNELAKRFNKLQQTFPEQFDFHPQTWMMPQQYSSLRKYMDGQGRGQTYIVKPQADCQGRGIYLVNRIQDVIMGRRCVVQKYIDNPLLIDNYKFDLRVYVLIGSLDPLRIYIYHDGLARFATETYQSAKRQNFKSCYQHLTNYAINKHNPKFREAQSGMDGEGGFKRSLRAVFNKIGESGIDTNLLWEKIEGIAIKTVMLGYQKMRNNYVSSQPEEYHNHMAFHVLGLDIFIDQNYEPYLLQVNHTPSFATQTPLDHRIKHALIKDTLILMKCHDTELKQELFTKSKMYSHNRIQNGIRQALQEDLRQDRIAEQLKKRQQYQENKMGGYRIIYPCADKNKMKKFNCILNKIKKTFETKKPKTKIQRKESIQSQKDPQKIKPKNPPKKLKQTLKQRETLITKPQAIKYEMSPKQQQLMKQKQKQKIRTKRLSLYSERVNQNMQQTLLSFVKYDLNSINDQMTYDSFPNAQIKNNRTFTIKTKFSIPDVNAKKINLNHASISNRGPSKIEKNKLSMAVSAISKEGNYIRPRNYDVPSLIVTSNFAEEHKVVKRRNKNGKIIFHISKPY